MFLLPLTVYMFFATGVNLFEKLPVVSPQVNEINHFKNDGVVLQNNITILGFLGKDVLNKRALVYNLAHKIYKPYYQFEDLQFVWVVAENQQEEVAQLLTALEQIADPSKWKFVYGSNEQINTFFESLPSSESLDELGSSSQVYIIDKERNLRGRDPQEEPHQTIGYDISTPAAINNKLRDDVKILLAEYRLELKENNRYKRKI